MSFLNLANRYYKMSKRLLFKSTRKPSRKEVAITSRITAIGIVVFGGIGYLISLMVNVIVSSG